MSAAELSVSQSLSTHSASRAQRAVYTSSRGGYREMLLED